MIKRKFAKIQLSITKMEAKEAFCSKRKKPPILFNASQQHPYYMRFIEVGQTLTSSHKVRSTKGCTSINCRVIPRQMYCPSWTNTCNLARNLWIHSSSKNYITTLKIQIGCFCIPFKFQRFYRLLSNLLLIDKLKSNSRQEFFPTLISLILS